MTFIFPKLPFRYWFVLGYDTLCLGNWFPTFRDISALEDETTKFSLNGREPVKWLHIPEGRISHKHLGENLKTNKSYLCFCTSIIHV